MTSKTVFLLNTLQTQYFYKKIRNLFINYDTVWLYLRCLIDSGHVKQQTKRFIHLSSHFFDFFQL